MKTNLDKELLDLISNKEFNELNISEKAIVTETITETEYNFHKKTFNLENINITPNASVKTNLDTAFKNKFKQRNYTLQKTIIGIAAVISISLFIFIIPKEKQQAETNIHTATLLSLGRIDDVYTKNSNLINYTDTITDYSNINIQ